MAAIDRTGAAALIPEDVQRDIVQGVPESSSCLKLMRKLPNMSRKQQRMPVLSALPTAYFVTGDTGQKKTTNQVWANKYLDAEELAVIVPIPDVVLDDADYDIWGEVKPRLMEAFGVAIDAAILFGTNAPSAWPMCILKAAEKSNNVVVLGTGSDIADDIGDTGGLMNLVEEDGYDVTGFAGAVGVKARLRGLRATGGELIYQPTLSGGTPNTLYGQPMEWVKNGAWSEATGTLGSEGATGGAHLIGGDFKQAVYSIRQDVTYKILSEATLYDTDGTTILYRLAQQDMVALRAVIRLAWQVPNPINRLEPDEFDWSTPGGAAGDYRYPFAALCPAGT